MQAPARQTSEAIGDHVLAARRAAGLKQEEVALAAGVSIRTVHAIEHGAPGVRLDSLTGVLSVLGLDLEVTRRRRRVVARQFPEDDE